MLQGWGPKPETPQTSRTRRVWAACALAGAIAACADDARASDTCLVNGAGYALSVTAGRTAVFSGAGFRVGLPDNGGRREPVEIEVDVVDPPAPSGLSRCSLWSEWPRCAWSRQEAGGSSGDPVTLEVYEPLDDKLVRYRQTKYVDGFEPASEAIEWRRLGDMRVERAR